MMSVNHVQDLYNRIDEYVMHIYVDLKLNILKRMIHDYRHTHSLISTDPEYYGLVLLDAIVSYNKESNITVAQQFDVNDNIVISYLSRCSKNDNIILRMVTHHFVYMSLHQLEQFEVWCQPLDIIA